MSMLKSFCIAAAVLFFSVAASAQQSATWKGGSFDPVVGQSAITDTEPATLHFVGIQNIAGSSGPYSFEWRVGSPDGKLLQQGTLSDATLRTDRTGTDNKLTVDKPTTICLVVYDSSSPTLRAVRYFEVGTR